MWHQNKEETLFHSLEILVWLKRVITGVKLSDFWGTAFRQTGYSLCGVVCHSWAHHRETSGLQSVMRGGGLPWCYSDYFGDLKGKNWCWRCMELNDWMSALGSLCTGTLMWCSPAKQNEPCYTLHSMVIDTIPAKQTLLQRGSGLHDVRAFVSRHWSTFSVARLE